MTEVKVTIKPDGTVIYEVEGSSGPSCVELTDFIDQMGDLENRELKPEYYESEEHINIRTGEN